MATFIEQQLETPGQYHSHSIFLIVEMGFHIRYPVMSNQQAKKQCYAMQVEMAEMLLR